MSATAVSTRPSETTTSSSSTAPASPATPQQQPDRKVISGIIDQLKNNQPHLEEDVEVSMDNLPPLEEVTKNMMEAVKKKITEDNAAGASDEAERINPEEYFTEKHIAPCFWLPRKEKYGGKRWLEEALFMFAHSRGFEYTSAARRFFKFNHEAKLAEIISLDEVPKDVAETMAKSALYYMPPKPDATGHPVVYASLRFFTWYDGYTLKQMKRMNMWLFWHWCSMFPRLAQVHGLRFVMSYNGFSMGCMNMEYKGWTDKVMQEMLPCKMSSCVLAYPPGWVDYILWPMMKLVMKQKILDRVQWFGTKPEKVKAKFMMHAFNKTTNLFATDEAAKKKFMTADANKNFINAESMARSDKEFPDMKELLATVPLDFGGTLDMTQEWARAYVFDRFTVSDETVPEGCECVPQKK